MLLTAHGLFSSCCGCIPNLYVFTEDFKKQGCSSHLLLLKTLLSAGFQDSGTYNFISFRNPGPVETDAHFDI